MTPTEALHGCLQDVAVSEATTAISPSVSQEWFTDSRVTSDLSPEPATGRYLASFKLLVEGPQSENDMTAAEAKLVAFDIAHHDVSVHSGDLGRELFFPSDGRAETSQPFNLGVEVLQVPSRTTEMKSVLRELRLRYAHEL